MAHLTTAEQIRAAGASAVTDWDLSDAKVEKVVALLMPVRDNTKPAPAKRGAA